MRRSITFSPRSRQRGATLVEALGVLFIAALMFLGLSMLINTSMQNIRDQQAAQYQAQLATAATQLVQANYQQLASDVAAKSPVVVPLKAQPGALQLASFLPASIQDKNAYGQSPCLLVTASPTGIDALLVTEGGQTIPDLELGYIAANAGKGGGSIPSKIASGAANNGAAYGAYGAWIIGAPNPTGQSCGSLPTAAGHLVSEVFTSAVANKNPDFLYRSRVAGYPDANAVHAPIYLNDTVPHAKEVLDADCNHQVSNAIGKITTDANGRLLVCVSPGDWEYAGSAYWLDPVATDADRLNLKNVKVGDVTLVLSTGVPWQYSGTGSNNGWHPLVVDNNGNLIIGDALIAAARLDLTKTNNIGDGCPDDSKLIASAGQISMDSSGSVLSCQNGTWQNQSQISPGGSDQGCYIIMGTPGAQDYPECKFQYTGTYPSGSGNPGYDSGTGSYSFTITRTVKLSKPGIISAAVWAHMYDEQCVGGKIIGTNRGQVAQYVSIYDNDTHTLIGRNQAQSPTIVNDAAGINVNLLQSASPNTKGYDVVLETDWANYDGIQTPYNTSYCGPKGNVVLTSPVVSGWTINSFY
ncbi:shufflon system plasmid conjugative transfer pilus tip adhesin PilV [Trinickia sp. NRRL B-1857]|uniref:shufflon system plasmid conjugative transfer pilus tip adhesin PilV n=1 Tax=Trinickia sp. NRRL B-1857 TaxID=3162879 RepID=UPI003D26B5BF